MRRMPEELRTFCRVALLFTAASWMVALVAALAKLPYPYNWPYFIRSDSLHDYWDYFERFKLFHTTDFFMAPGYPFTYMAPGAVLYWLFYSLGLKGGLLAYLVEALASVMAGFALLQRAMVRRGLGQMAAERFLFCTLLTSYPIIFCVDRGNLEIVVATGLAVGTWAYWTGRSWTAAVLWGLFGSVKLYPLILLALFLSAKQYRQLATAIGTAVASTLLSLEFVGPDFGSAVAGIQHGLNAFLAYYSLRFEWGIGYDHSLLSLIRLTLGRTDETLLHVYLVTMAIVMLTVYFLYIRRLPIANQLLLLSVASILLPPTSSDYTLVQLYAPFAVLVLIALDSRKQRVGLNLAFGLLGVLFTPTNFIFHNQQVRGAQIKCVLLIWLFVIALRNPWGVAREEVAG